MKQICLVFTIVASLFSTNAFAEKGLKKICTDYGIQSAENYGHVVIKASADLWAPELGKRGGGVRRRAKTYLVHLWVEGCNAYFSNLMISCSQSHNVIRVSKLYRPLFSRCPIYGPNVSSDVSQEPAN